MGRAGVPERARAARAADRLMRERSTPHRRAQVVRCHRLAAQPQQSQRFRGELTEPDVALAAGKLIRSDELEHPRPLGIRIARRSNRSS